MIAEEIFTALVEVSRPSPSTDLPYKSYSLTRVNGEPVERVLTNYFLRFSHGL